MPCCGRTPFEARGDRLTMTPELVNCDRMRLKADVARLREIVRAFEEADTKPVPKVDICGLCGIPCPCNLRSHDLPD